MAAWFMIGGGHVMSEVIKVANKGGPSVNFREPNANESIPRRPVSEIGDRTHPLGGVRPDPLFFLI